MTMVTMKRIRCGCSEEQKKAAGWHGSRTPPEPCPHPREVEDLGNGDAVVTTTVGVEQETIRKEH